MCCNSKNGKNIPNKCYRNKNIFYDLYYAACKKCLTKSFSILDVMSQFFNTPYTLCHTMSRFVEHLPPLEVQCN